MGNKIAKFWVSWNMESSMKDTPIKKYTEMTLMEVEV